MTLRNQHLQNGGTIWSVPDYRILPDVIRRPGEELAASSFVALIFYLFLDINLGIYRVFKRRQGLYYWCMLLGTWGCVIDAIAVILKYFLPNSERLWPLYTLFVLAGWTIYAPAQLLVLYSRLHLVNQDHVLQRWILIMIIAVATLMIVPTWPLVWQAYNPYDSRLSALYSPREAILDRCTQLGYTLAESVLSGIYVWSLTKLLNLKSSVRQRRVMNDLIYVNIIAVGLDVLTVVLVFLNRTGISHPVQAFSYILKLKLEFMVLNQLMAVAARGVQKETFAERRYHHPSTSSEKSSSVLSTKSPKWGLGSLPGVPKTDAAEIVVPSPSLPKVHGPSNGLSSKKSSAQADGGKWPMKARFKKRRANDRGTSVSEDDDEDIGVHMWEKRGKLVMEVPWFRTDGKA